jgi:hypothetical protein
MTGRPVARAARTSSHQAGGVKSSMPSGRSAALVLERGDARDEVAVGDLRAPVHEVAGHRRQPEPGADLLGSALALGEDHTAQRPVQGPVAQPAQGRGRGQQAGAERRGVGAGDAQRRDGGDDARDAAALAGDRAGHGALLGDDDVGAEPVHHAVDLGDPGGDRPDEDVADGPLERGQARLAAGALVVEVGVVEVERRLDLR